MTRWAAWGMIAIGMLHFGVVGRDAIPELGGWLSGDLWSYESIRPLAEQREPLVRSSHAFWATIGSFAAPFILLGLLVLHLDRRGFVLPPFVGWSIGGWSLVASLINQPSGFPIGILIGAMLVGARPRTR